nr:MAG TPA: protein of unknown function (DUF4485) [Caudoviricetes sp.]
MPTRYRDELVRNIKEVKQIMEKVWADDKYRSRAAKWLRKY